MSVVKRVVSLDRRHYSALLLSAERLQTLRTEIINSQFWGEADYCDAQYNFESRIARQAMNQ